MNIFPPNNDARVGQLPNRGPDSIFSGIIVAVFALTGTMKEPELFYIGTFTFSSVYWTQELN